MKTVLGIMVMLFLLFALNVVGLVIAITAFLFLPLLDTWVAGRKQRAAMLITAGIVFSIVAILCS